MPADSPLDQQTALVTGAAHRSGRATALAMARAGARVVINDLAPDQQEAATIVVDGGMMLYPGFRGNG